MKYVLTSRESALSDAYMMKKTPSKQLMENAAKRVVKHICSKFKGGRVAIFCGTGNNGGDGFAVGRLLINKGFKVKVFYVGDIETATKETKENFFALKKTTRIMLSAQLVEKAENKPWDIIIDALFGVGLNRNIEGIYADIIEYINKQKGYKIAIDIPSGVCGDNGNILGVAFKADATITFQHKKIGHLLGACKNYCGKLILVKIGKDKKWEENIDVQEFQTKDFKLKARKEDSNKGDYGKLLIAAGSNLMSGAALLCAKSASKTGVGLINLASVNGVLDVIKNNLPEAVLTLLEGDIQTKLNIINNVDKTAIAVGCGMGMGEETTAIVKHLITTAKQPLVIDADGINALSTDVDVLLNRENSAQIMLTPHLKEFSRLINLSVEEIKVDAINLASKFAQEYNVVLLLKGATTIVANPKGRVVLVCCGSSGMAKGGSGDVLTGCIGGLVAQGYTPFESCIYGTYICGKSGELATKKYGAYSQTPTDTIAMMHKITKKQAR